MMTYIGLLRGVNVGGHKAVSMGDLRGLLSTMGFEDPRTLLVSGNIVFRTARGPTAALEKRLEGEAKKRLGLETLFFVRTPDEWKSLIAGNPFPREALHDPSHLLAMPLKNAPSAAAVKALVGAIRGRESVRVRGDIAYITYPDGIGTSKLTNTLIESTLDTRGTARNWNTVLKLAALAAD